VTSPEPDFMSLDADALGEALVPLFFDDAGAEWATSLFPRIVTRYQTVRGDLATMREFLLHQLHVSIEAQEEAKGLLSGEQTSPEPPRSPPPPAHVVPVPTFAGSTGGNGEGVLGERMQHQESSVRDKAAKVIKNLIEAKDRRSHSDARERNDAPAKEAVSREQQDRGRRGEEEMKRRLVAPGGWEGFTFLSDKRDQRCGYDFLCLHEGREVKLEVKTFTLNGRIMVTVTELQESAANRQDYFLIGVLEDGPATSWPTIIAQDPLPFLITYGEFEIEASLELPAVVLLGMGHP